MEGVTSGRTHATPIWRVVLFALLIAVPVVILVGAMTNGIPVGETSIDVVGLVAYGGLAGLIIFRRDGNPVGWLLLALGATVVGVSNLQRFPGVSPTLSAWVDRAGWSFVFGFFAAMTLVIPDGCWPVGDSRFARIGRLAGRWLLPAAVVVSALASEIEGIGPDPVSVLPSWVWFPSYLLVVVILIGGAVSLVVRRRHSTGVERAQLGWVVLPLAFLVFSIVGTLLWVLIAEMVQGEDPGDGPWIVVYVAMLSFPIAFGVAVLRYRLYDIDRIISRTVSYGLVSAVLAGVYLAAVFLLGNLPPLEGELAVAASTLLAAALFNPLRRRIQNSVDRRFNRSRLDIERTMEVMARRLSNQVDLSELGRELQQTAGQTMQPDTVSVWVRETENPRLLRP